MTTRVKNLTATMLIIGPVRLSYLHVFATATNKLRKCEEYSCVLLIPKAPTPECPEPNKLVKAIREASETALIEKFKTLPKKFDPRLLDGDIETNNEGEPKAPGYWLVAARSDADKPAPVLIDKNRAPVLAANEWVSGDWGYVKISLYGYEFEGTRGVGAGLRAIQFTIKGEPLGATQDPEAVAAEFDDVEADFLA